MKYIYSFNSPLGNICLQEENRVITGILLDKEFHGVKKKTPLIAKTCVQLNEYFQDERRFFDIALEAHGTVFQKKIWQELAKIPYGTTISYKELAALKHFGRQVGLAIKTPSPCSYPVTELSVLMAV